MKTARIQLKNDFTPYPEYKDSGIEWVGKIPKEWDLLKFKSLFSASDERVEDDRSVEQILSVSGYRGIEKKNIKSMDGQMPSEDISAYRIVRPGQLVVNTMWLNYTGLGVSDFTGYVSPAYRSYNIASLMDPKFVHYLLRSILYVQKYSSLLYGIRPNSLQVKPADFEKIEIVMPPIEAQKKIAEYLDEKMMLIDTIIEKKKKLIELLREKRTAVINQAVTKGLDHNVELVDSGIEWIGEIPKEWKVDRMSHYFITNDGGVWGEDDPLETGRIVLRSTEINKDGSWDLSNAITRKLTYVEFEKGRLFENDLLITKSSGSADHLGKTAIVSREIEERGCAYSNFMQRARLNSKILPKFFFFLINNKIGRDQINYWGLTTSGLVNLNASLIGRFIFPIPVIRDQEKIIEFLERRTDFIDGIINKVEQSVKALKEFKAALISNVVTGKVKV